MSLGPGTRIGSYEVVSAIGAGGMGELYKARDARLKRDVALKVLPGAFANDPERLARFEREAEVLASLNHPHIVTIYSTEEADGVRFLTMELIRGRRLDEVISEGGVAWPSFFNIAVPLADALAAAHEQGIIHRDLKPANIMLTDSGRVKVLDFGLARFAQSAGSLMDDGTTRLELSGKWIVTGTLPYMSPEQIENRPLDQRTDLFSFGIVLFEMATGERPFKGGSAAGLISAILKDAPLRLGDVRCEPPGGVVALIERCLEKKVQARIASAREARELLEKARDDRHESATKSLSGAMPARSRHPEEPRKTRRHTEGIWIAVLPLSFRTDDTRQLAEGLTEDITNGLSKFPFLRVIAQMDVERAAGASSDARRVGVALGARYLLSGSVRLVGEIVRVGVQLVDTAAGIQIWAETFEHPMTSANVFVVQDQITKLVVGTVADDSGVLVRAVAGAISECACENLTVGQLVLRFFVYLHHLKPEEHARLRTAFEHALANEPAHAQGWACLAELYEHEFSMDLNPLPDSHVRARRTAERAIELDPTCQDGWCELAACNFFSRDEAAFRAAADRALSVNPLNPMPVSYIGLLLAFGSDWDRGVALVERTMSANPHHPGWLHFVPFYYCYRARDYERALLHIKRVNMPWFHWQHLNAAAVAGQLGRSADARAALKALGTTAPTQCNVTSARAGWALWLWDEELVHRLEEGLAKAFELAGHPRT